MKRLPDGLAVTDQKRMLRMVVAYLTLDPRQAQAVFEEIYTDKRGAMFAQQAIINALTGALGEAWTSTVSSTDLVAKLRELLLRESAEEEEDHG